MASVLTPVLAAVSGDKPPVGTLGLYCGTITIAAGNYATGGLALKAALETVLAAIAAGNPGYVDRGVTIEFLLVVGIAGYTYEYSKASGKLLIRYNDNDAGADGPAIELPAAATPAGVTGDTVKFLAAVVWS